MTASLYNFFGLCGLITVFLPPLIVLFSHRSELRQFFAESDTISHKSLFHPVRHHLVSFSLYVYTLGSILVFSGLIDQLHTSFLSPFGLLAITCSLLFFILGFSLKTSTLTLHDFIGKLTFFCVIFIKIVLGLEYVSFCSALAVFSLIHGLLELIVFPLLVSGDKFVLKRSKQIAFILSFSLWLFILRMSLFR